MGWKTLIERQWIISGERRGQGQFWSVPKKADGGGTKVIETLARDLKRGFPEMRGLSPRNLKCRKAFAGAYPWGFGTLENRPGFARQKRPGTRPAGGSPGRRTG